MAFTGSITSQGILCDGCGFLELTLRDADPQHGASEREKGAGVRLPADRQDGCGTPEAAVRECLTGLCVPEPDRVAAP